MSSDKCFRVEDTVLMGKTKLFHKFFDIFLIQFHIKTSFLKKIQEIYVCDKSKISFIVLIDLFFQRYCFEIERFDDVLCYSNASSFC